MLKTYEDERREPAITTLTQSLENHRNVARLAAAAYNPAGGDLGAEEILRESRRYGNHLGVEFGTVYRSAAVIDDGTEPPDVEDSYCDYAPCATPGCRAPHIWLGNEFDPVSTVDLFGAGFTVLTGPGGEIWRKAAADAARQLGVPIVSYAIGDPGLADHNNTFFVTTRSATTGRSSCVPTGMSPGAAQPGTPTVPRLSKPSSRSWIAARNGVSADSPDESSSSARAPVA